MVFNALFGEVPEFESEPFFETYKTLSVTVTLHVAVLPYFDVAVIIAFPLDFAVTVPLVFTVAILLFDDFHVITFDVVFVGLKLTVRF